MKLMIVDDHPGARKLIREVLARPGDTVCECASGNEAVARAKDFQPDWVTMDVHMPGLSGFQTASAIRATLPLTRVVMVTNDDGPGLRLAALQAGAVSHVAKENLLALRELVAGPAAATVPGSAAPAQDLQAMQRNLERFRLLVENSLDLVLEISREGTILYITPNALSVLGFEPQELVHTNVFARVHPEDLPHAHEQFALPQGRVTCRYQHKDGSWRWVETTGRDFFNSLGEQRSVLIARDVTDRKNAEEAVRQSEERMRAILENALEAVVTMSADGLITGWNTRAETIFGWPRAEALGRKMSELLAPERFRARVEAELRRFLAAPQTSPLSRPWETIALRRDGREIPVELAITPLRTAGTLGFSGFIRDLSAQKEDQAAKAELEAQLRQTQKLDALGTLAGGIAHDFNNILTVIMAYADLATMEAHSPVEVRRHLAEILTSSARARDLVQQILTFSRRQKQERKPTRLQQVVKEALRLLRSTLPATIEIEAQIDPATPVVLADMTQIHQVMMNLCTNAAHAMRERPGCLTVILEPFEVNEGLAQLNHGLHPGRYARLTVSDTGHGMAAETLKRAFEPFFTTKERGEGTGLGLAVVHGIIREHEGAITVQSRPEEGTTFSLYFPAQPLLPDEAVAGPRSIPAGAGQHILLVDDEPSICISVRAILERLGYRVTTRTDPVEALSEFRLHPGEFHLVITDLTMPHMTGTDLARQISEHSPNTPVLLTTGSSGTWTLEKVRALGIHDLMEKPASAVDLAVTVHRLLTRAAAERGGTTDSTQTT